MTTNYKTLQSLIQDAKSRIESNPTDIEYVNTQYKKIMDWKNEIIELQSKYDFKLSDKTHTFNTVKEFKELINNEKKIAKRLYMETKLKAYSDYELFARTTLENYREITDEQVQDLKIDNLKEFIVFEYVKWWAKFEMNCKIMSNFDSKNRIRPVEAYYHEGMLYHMDKIKEIFKHGQTSLQEQINN